jgi:peptidyl-prolyl cis-trans isomerase A (cyclophilin A)
VPLLLQPATRPAVLFVRFETGAGSFLARLEAAAAPVTVHNFVRYVTAGHYDGGLFHRTVTLLNQPNDAIRIEVVQAGAAPDKQRQDFPAIPLERTSVTGLRHVDGAISMARAAPDTATSDFFICLGPQPELDFGGRRNPDGQGFAAFGQVVDGMETVRRIHRSPAEGQRLAPPVRIIRARLVEEFR